MADDKMPLMLENAMPVDLQDVDDLFGDGVGVGLAMTSSPPSRQLVQRVDQLRRSGCCQSIAWSRAGTIASISPDGKSLEFRNLRCNPEDASWELSEPTVSDLISGTDDNPLVHVVWAGTNSQELAVIDAVGRISILSFNTCLNRPYHIRKSDADPVDDLHAVVGCYWLNLMPQGRQYNVLHGPAVKNDNGYRYESSFVHAFGPWHPNPAKSSLVCITSHGVLRLLWPQNATNKVEFNITTLDLESVNCSEDQVTHASICSEKNSLIMVLATASKQLRVIRLLINWGLPPSEKQALANTPLNPTLTERHMAVTSFLPTGPNELPLDSDMASLSHLEVLSSTLDSGAQGFVPPVILTIRTFLPVPNSPYQEVQSIIDRWEILHDQTQTLHSEFTSLGNKQPSSATDPQPVTRLRKLDPIVINKVVVSLQTIQFGRVICLIFADGTVEYRDRLNMGPMYNEVDLDRIMSLHHVGFSFAEEPSCLQAAFSPTNASIAQICHGGKIKWNPMRFSGGDIGESIQDAQYAAVLASLTVAAGTATFYHMNYDDILAIAHPYAEKPRFAFDWTRELVRMFKIAVDYSEESHHDNLVRNNLLQLCFSILNSLGFRGHYRPRSFGSKLAMLAINARNIVILITIASNTPISIQKKLSPLDEPEVVDALSGCARWSLDLLSWLSNSLFELMDDKKFTDLLTRNTFSGLTNYLVAKNDVALHMLLCSSTRGFLVAVCRRLTHLEALSNRAIEFWEKKLQSSDGHQGRLPNSAVYGAYQRMQLITTSGLIKAQDFDKLLTVLGADIRSAYTSMATQLSKKMNQPAPQAGSAMSKPLEEALKQTQAEAELNMLLAAPLPSPFLPVILNFFNTHVPSFRAQTDPASLFFADYSLLEAESNPESLAQKRRQRMYVDVFKRVKLVQPLPGAAAAAAALPWRQCVRCASVMEDVTAAGVGIPQGYTFVLSQQRKCSCSGSWSLLPNAATVN